MYRQGDVLLVRVAAIAVPASVAARPRQPRDGRGRLVLVPDEGQDQGGGAYVVDGPGRLLGEAGGSEESWLELTGAGRLEHGRHAPVALPAGWYRVVRRRVYTPVALGGRADF